MMVAKSKKYTSLQESPVNTKTYTENVALKKNAQKLGLNSHQRAQQSCYVDDTNRKPPVL